MTISLGTELYVRVGAPATYNEAGFDAISDWIEVGEVGSIPELGGTAQVNEFISLASGIVEKYKGSINYGGFTFPARTEYTDAGQIACKSGFDGDDKDETFSVRLLNSEFGSLYFTAIISGYVYNIGDANTVYQNNVTLEINNEVIVDADGLT